MPAPVKLRFFAVARWSTNFSNRNAGFLADAKVETTALQKKMKPHSHVEDKTGIPQMILVAMPDKPNAANDRTKHFHPRDRK